MTRPRALLARPGAVALAVIALSLVAPAGRPPDKPQAQATGPVIRLAYRALQPGEPIVVFLETDGTAKSASVTFLGRTVDLRPALGGRSVFAFLGIDLQAKPGSHTMIIKVRKAGGTIETIRKELLVSEKEFPFTKLQLKREYVTPPAAALERIKREAELVALATSVVTPEWLGDGPFALPHDAPNWANFGQRRLNNNVLESVHAGLDIRAPFGETIRAANAGTVVLASDLYLGGKTVIVDHGLGVFSSYGHMSKLLVKRGEAVKKGAAVGLCGTTGRSTGPHLHWSVKILDVRVDPEAMLRLPIGPT
ncbi:MAG: M23 family metallopeptidase [Acidobacteria bacterium]|nr:M23 family metallopeptidase [Acidobacteriota bacterium]